MLVPVESDRGALRGFFRQSLGLSAGWAPATSEVINLAAPAWREGRPAEAAAVLRQAAEDIRANLSVIEGADFCAPLLRSDISGWLPKYAMGASWFDALATVLEGCTVESDRSLSAPAHLRELIDNARREFEQSYKRLFADCFEFFFTELGGEIRFRS